MVHINELPPCLLVEVFSHLPIREVFRLKLVCKAWQEISGYVRPKNLSIYYRNRKVKADEFYLRHYGRYRDYDLYVNDLKKFTKSTDTFFVGLKRLVCFFVKPLKHESVRMQEFLYRFNRVEELQITVTEAYWMDPPITFTLEFERLRKLFLRYERRIFHLHCPQLSYLDTGDLNFCSIRYPEKLRTLVVNVPYDDNAIGRFLNLKNAIFYFMESIRISPKLFDALPKGLQKLIFIGKILRDERFSSERELEECFRAQYGIDQEDSSRLRVFFLGVEIELSRFTRPGREPLPNFISDNEFPKFLASNLEKSVDANVCLDYIDYTALERLLPTFDLLHQKIYSAHPNCEVSVQEDVADQTKLLEFIRKAKPIRLAIWSGAIFSRPFFDRITEICSPFIKMIYFHAGDLGSEPDALNFLLEMTKLEEINVYSCRFSVIRCLDFAMTAFEKIESLERFDFNWFVIWHRYFAVSYHVRDKDGVEHFKHAVTFFDENENGLDVIRSMIARLKQKRSRRASDITPELNDSMDLDELYSMTEKMEKRLGKRLRKNYRTVSYHTRRFVRRLKGRFVDWVQLHWMRALHLNTR